MPAANHPSSPVAHRSQERQRGTAAVEFAMVAILFFMLVFGAIEFSRMMYLINTLAEVTRRAASAAASTDFSNAAALDDVRRKALFNTGSSTLPLPLAMQISVDTIKIDYLSVQRSPGGSFTMAAISAGSLPTSPAQNRQACIINPYADNCIRLVRVRVCDPAFSGSCEPIRFQAIVPLVNLSFPLPLSTAILRAESLGLTP
jgi:Flp pilus assembly protein TadG